MMFGLREFFDYIECSNCGCLQIKEIPEDMDKYYVNEKYYSFNTNPLRNHFIKKLSNKRDEYCLFKNNFLGKVINVQYPNLFLSILGGLNIDYNSKILDVGCGSGNFLLHLKELNFNELTGIDLNIEKSTITEDLKILKMDLADMPTNKKYDFIIFSHSFEHMTNPVETLKKVENILSKNGRCIIRMPVKTSYIWQKYGVDWVQIDAPRHFFIYTRGCLIINFFLDLIL